MSSIVIATMCNTNVLFVLYFEISGFWEKDCRIYKAWTDRSFNWGKRYFLFLYFLPRKYGIYKLFFHLRVLYFEWWNRWWFKILNHLCYDLLYAMAHVHMDYKIFNERKFNDRSMLKQIFLKIEIFVTGPFINSFVFSSQRINDLYIRLFVTTPFVLASHPSASLNRFINVGQEYRWRWHE